MGYKKMLQERRERERAQAAQKAQADTAQQPICTKGTSRYRTTTDTQDIVPAYVVSYPQSEFQALFEGIEDF